MTGSVIADSVSRVIRAATPEDIPELLRLIRELADYQGHLADVQAREEELLAALFPAERAPAVFAHVGEVEGEVVGMAIWFPSFSTWTGRHGIWLEDLFVQAAHRGTGLGVALLNRLAQECRERGYPRMEWHVAQWNAPSIRFYESIGATGLDDQRVFRLSGAPLSSMAARS